MVKIILFSAMVLMQLQSLAQPNKVLVFSKTDGFRHESIEPGKLAFSKLAKENNFKVDFSEDASVFNKSNLKNYNAVVFLNTTGDILNNDQQGDFERFIQSGGGYLGIHAATDCEYNWPWYGMLAGAFFLDHPNTPSNVQSGKFEVVDKNSWATKGMPDQFERKDEFYNFKNINPAIHVLVTIDETTYVGGKNGKGHPISWYHEFEGGRAFYTVMGHTNESFTEPLFLNHILAGLNYVMRIDAPQALDYSKAKPEENRFTKVVLAEKLNEPVELTVLDDNRVLFVERHGAVRLFDLKTKKLKTIATIPVSTKYKDKEGKISEAEDGLLGLTKDPNFDKNHWVYMYYSDPNQSANILTRYTLNGEVLNLKSKKVILTVNTQREQCCHTGGSLTFDNKGNLLVSTGDNTNPHGSNGYSPIDERIGRSPWDAQKSSGNTNDLRGKILRITPKADGSYTIPDGNLFSIGTPKTRPEIYTMGHRNPYRISIDQKNNFLYWGDVGPDASADDLKRGPAGHDEVGQARKAGNFGWPYFIGDNKPYWKYNFTTEKSEFIFNASKPENNSPNNTGLTQLPQAEKAFQWYPYSDSKEFPLVGNGGRTAMAGPVYHIEDFKNASRAFSKYYDGKLFTYEWMRGWIMANTLDAEGNLVSMESFMPSYKFSNPMDMEFASNGDLYMLEYGSGWFSQNDDARLIRIEYNGGNRKPAVKLNVSKFAGALPFKTNLSTKGTKDADGDILSYSWTVTSNNGFKKSFQTENIDIAFDKPGVYKATVQVDDHKGGVTTESVELIAGNEPPQLSFNMHGSNKSFYFNGKTYNYSVDVTDKEDGKLDKSNQVSNAVSVNIDYLPEGFDKIEIAQGHKAAEEVTNNLKGMKLIQLSDCKACHATNKKSVGPAFYDVSVRYKNKANADQKIAKKIISGGSGNWGEVPMAAHPQLSAADAAEMAKYILSLAQPKLKANSLPSNGIYTVKLPSTDKGQGVFVFKAAYKDRGYKNLPSIGSEETFILKSPKINASNFEIFNEVNKMSFNDMKFVIPSKSGAYIGLSNIDMTSLSKIKVAAMAPKAQLNAAGGYIQLRLDQPNGAIVGESKFIGDSGGGFGAAPVVIDLKPTVGNHDLYFVFKNDEIKVAQSLMVVTDIEIKAEGTDDIKLPVEISKTNSIEEYAGKYLFKGLPFESIIVSIENGKVFMDISSQKMEVKPTGVDEKYDAEGKATFQFVRDAKNKVVKLKLIAMGQSFDGEKN